MEVKFLSLVAEMFRLGFETNTGIGIMLSIDRVYIYIYTGVLISP